MDVAADLMRDIDPRVQTAVIDIASPAPLPEVDAVICAGVIQYVFEDAAVAALLARIRAPVIWIRSTCTLLPERENVERDGYASCYRTVPETHALISENHRVTGVDRVYPDEVESKFGTKQFYFEARRRN